MSVLEIRTFPDPVLLRPAGEVAAVDAAVRRLIDDMAETMYRASGAGLAAPQVGVSLRVVTVDVGRRPGQGTLLCLVNPLILEARGDEYEEEGCLSIPDFSARIHRASAVRVQGLDPEGRTSVIEAEGMLARALQHEIDHLNGMLIIDRLRGLKKEMVRKKMRKQARDLLT